MRSVVHVQVQLALAAIQNTAPSLRSLNEKWNRATLRVATPVTQSTQNLNVIILKLITSRAE